jgi:hypothetical protein
MIFNKIILSNGFYFMQKKSSKAANVIVADLAPYGIVITKRDF